MSKDSGTLSGEGLKFGGEWANTLYDKQVKNIVEDVTGGKVEMLDLGLPIDTKENIQFRPVNERGVHTSRNLLPSMLKTGMEIEGSKNGVWGDYYIITDILGDGKFKAVPKSAMNIHADKMSNGKYLSYGRVFDTLEEAVKNSKEFMQDVTETFDISTKTTQQQGIRLTPEIKARIRGEAPPMKKPSGKSPLGQAYGAIGGIEKDEEGNIRFNPEKAALGLLGAGVAKKVSTRFTPPKNLSTKLLNKFSGEPTTIPIQRFNEIINKSQKEGIKKVDLDMVRSSAEDMGDTINLNTLSERVEKQLVPLTPTSVKSPRWSHIGEDFIGDGKYGEVVYQSPVKTSAGDIHFMSKDPAYRHTGKTAPDEFPNYFSHVRFEDKGSSRKLLETQSDLMQKENFAREFQVVGREGVEFKKNPQLEKERMQDLAKLENYESNDPLAHLRTFREEVKRAAKDGKTTLLTPTGKTAMKIEGLGVQTDVWRIGDNYKNADLLTMRNRNLTSEVVGKTIFREGNENDAWIITDILGDGKFKAMPTTSLDDVEMKFVKAGKLDEAQSYRTKEKPDFNSLDRMTETFDISGNVDTKHFVYKLNEDSIPKEARRMGLEVEKIEQDGAEWWKISVPKERANMPTEAFVFAGLGLLGGMRERNKNE
jgi:hypothetical protein